MLGDAAELGAVLRFAPSKEDSKKRKSLKVSSHQAGTSRTLQPFPKVAGVDADGRIACRLYLFKLGIAPQIQDLLGKVDFTEEEISNMRKELEKYGIQMPSFSKIGGILANELSVDEAALHAAVIAINEAVEKGIAEQTIVTLRNPNAVLTLVDDNLAPEYQKELWDAKKKKEESARLKNSCISEEERDVYEELLTQAEIQGNINKVNRQAALEHINAVIPEGDPENTLLALKKPEAQLPAVYPFAAAMYQNELFNLQKQNAMNYLAHEELLIAVEMLSAVALLNQALESNDLVSVQNQLRSPTIGLNNLDKAYVERQAKVGISGLKVAQLYEEVLSQGQDNLSWNEIQNCIDMVNAQIQEENDHISQDGSTNLSRCSTSSVGGWGTTTAPSVLLPKLTKQLYQVISIKSAEMHALPGIVAVGYINEAIDEGNPSRTLETLLLPTANISDVDPAHAQHYQDVLYHAKSQKRGKLIEVVGIVTWNS
ncbi:Ras GTPase-activating-like protein iqgap2 [Saguinus oedipus]|uniref:Ras GTPase-activating-like protein iqgap2 n=1 Tax=Saguinus oedipus TaxID=9490 RepID=A0ABQ9W8S4_SAGOE|nr:Ras GTPase-activating-like protein iqgap2 [Saguinus oedipus]